VAERQTSEGTGESSGVVADLSHVTFRFSVSLSSILQPIQRLRDIDSKNIVGHRNPNNVQAFYLSHAKISWFVLDYYYFFLIFRDGNIGGGLG
jgi:hypothetical protein